MTALLTEPGLAHPTDQASRLRALVEALSADISSPSRSVRRKPAPGVPIVSIGSGKGGVGKTNLAVNLCIALAQSGRRVTLLDADLGMANADVLCGLTPSRRLDAILTGPEGRATLTMRDVAVECPCGFLLVPGAVGVARVADLDTERRAGLVAGLCDIERVSDLIVIDTGAGIGRDVTTFLSAATLGVVVATPEPTSLTDAYGLIKCLHLQAHERGEPQPRLGLVVNQAASEAEARSVHERLAGCAGRFLRLRVPLLGWIAQDPRVQRAVMRRTPHMVRWPRCRASRAVRGLCGAIVAEVGLCEAVAHKG